MLLLPNRIGNVRFVCSAEQVRDRIVRQTTPFAVRRSDTILHRADRTVSVLLFTRLVCSRNV